MDRKLAIEWCETHLSSWPGSMSTVLAYDVDYPDGWFWGNDCEQKVRLFNAVPQRSICEFDVPKFSKGRPPVSVCIEKIKESIDDPDVSVDLSNLEAVLQQFCEIKTAVSVHCVRLSTSNGKLSPKQIKLMIDELMIASGVEPSE